MKNGTYSKKSDGRGWALITVGGSIASEVAKLRRFVTAIGGTKLSKGCYTMPVDGMEGMCKVMRMIQAQQYYEIEVQSIFVTGIQWENSRIVRGICSTTYPVGTPKPALPVYE